MPSATKPSCDVRNDDSIQQQLESLRKDILVPGFWELLGTNCTTWASEISAGPFWTRLKTSIEAWRTEYKGLTGAALLSSTGVPPFEAKLPESAKRKVFRRCREDANFVHEAFSPEGPPIPGISDLVRTRLVCQYVDGVEFLATKVFGLAEDCKLTPQRTREGRVDGYFAQHVNLHHEGFYRVGGIPQAARIPCEIQIASELATRMWAASHPFYEVSREVASSAETWQWNPENPRFISNQLGHMIHLADGLLVQLRLAARKK